MLEIVEGKAIGSSGCRPALGSGLSLGTPARGAGQRGLAWREKLKYRRAGRGMKRAPQGELNLRAQDAGGMVPIDPS